jgi:hypothetical protein
VVCSDEKGHDVAENTVKSSYRSRAIIIFIRELTKKSLSVPQASKVEWCQSRLEVLQAGRKAVAFCSRAALSLSVRQIESLHSSWSCRG